MLRPLIDTSNYLEGDSVNRRMLLLGTLLILVAACTASPDASTPEPVEGALYIHSADLLIMESYPVQVALVIAGELPTPCHEFLYQYEIQDLGDEKRIDVRAYSVADTEEVCIQVLQPFEEQVSFDLRNALEGIYVVYLNGERVGEFSYPA